MSQVVALTEKPADRRDSALVGTSVGKCQRDSKMDWDWESFFKSDVQDVGKKLTKKLVKTKSREGPPHTVIKSTPNWFQFLLKGNQRIGGHD
jgi:hypothetical protein